MLQPEARVLGHQFVQRIGELLLVAMPRSGDRHALHRRPRVSRAQVMVVLIVGIVQYRIEMHVIHLGHGA